MVGSKPGFDRCVASRRSDQLESFAAGHAFVQNIRRGHYEIATDAPVHHRLLEAFDELALAI